MNHTRSLDKKTGLLVSVRDAAEARIAVSSQCVSIIDLKEPANGSLGCVSMQTANEILGCLPEGAMKSIALGEITDWPIWPTADAGARNEVLARFDFAKLGLSGMANDPNWAARWERCLAKLPKDVQRVAVAYADSDRAGSPSMQVIMKSAIEVGCSVLLIDTFCKDNGGLLDLFSVESLSQVVREARAIGLKVVLAGSLDAASIELLKMVKADFVGVRGAVCGAERTSMIQARKIAELEKLVCHGGSSSIEARPASSIPEFPEKFE